VYQMKISHPVVWIAFYFHDLRQQLFPGIIPPGSALWTCAEGWSRAVRESILPHMDDFTGDPSSPNEATQTFSRDLCSWPE